jgi:hypothetical protein
MFNRDVLDLFPRVAVGARVTVTWERFSASNDLAGRPRLREMYRSDLPRRF